ncbi:biotin/acetyl-CoA-carboxylase ligase [Rippkaea orientalis PCC 8801]|uniref:Biotin/acetyl-CoA-carboxylase ligase n=1 Tax=Rippkaea orientalis (strain PCC 8801 / RF-1) TaxID=41431 RepID=B7K5N8_RIPO1|nr:biotin--[acetyl-CoA-carboxylase] ligase [Rippkaea orientalis]ACK66771.1 biotin/acetyl-CoA-carboxylase ligase [Rippkaea orientalis PCC 8801]
MTLNQELLKKHLATITDVPSLSQLSLYYFDTIPSTNQMAWELLDQGKKPPFVAIASQQTAGRGQWGRSWQSSPGGLYLSVAIAPSILTQHFPHLTLFSGWGIADVLNHYQIPVRLKWPNDLIIEGQKLGGIKTEIRTQNNQINYAVIGVGINYSNTVPTTGITLESWATNSGNFLTISSLEQLATIVIQGLFNGYEYYLNYGSDQLLTAYLKLFDGLGRSIMIEGVPGTILGVTSQGELTVRLHSQGSSTQINLPPGSISLGYFETGNP